MEAYRYLAQAYDTLMADVDYDSWADYIYELMGGGGRVFETACGTGSITQRLCRKGCDVVAADISEAMLRVAAENARRAGCDVTFLRQDLRAVSVGNRVDAVVCACDGVNYVDMAGVAAFAASAFAALKGGGRLLFDISTRAKLTAMDGQVYYDDADDATCLWRNEFDAAAGALTMDVTLFVRRGQLFERFSETHVQYAHDIKSVREVLAQAGFADIKVLEFPTREACGQETQRAQFVCVKR